jgi:hypothetical protein
MILVVGCHGAGPLEVTGSPSTMWTVRNGEELRITMPTVGPGQYDSPPSISGSAVTFVDMTVISNQSPGGLSQLFRFTAVASGQALITFHNPAPDGNLHPDIVDTVIVR